MTRLEKIRALYATKEHIELMIKFHEIYEDKKAVRNFKAKLKRALAKIEAF